MVITLSILLLLLFLFFVVLPRYAPQLAVLMKRGERMMVLIEIGIEGPLSIGQLALRLAGEDIDPVGVTRECARLGLLKEMAEDEALGWRERRYTLTTKGHDILNVKHDGLRGVIELFRNSGLD